MSADDISLVQVLCSMYIGKKNTILGLSFPVFITIYYLYIEYIADANISILHNGPHARARQ